MIYKDFKGLKLSNLGFGCMRLPVIDKKDDAIDKEQVKRMVALAMEKGINYFDTAWGYHGGNSELVMGEVLSEYPRDSFFLASKFPGYDVKNIDKDKVGEIFEEQLRKCRTEYFDFYLFHNVNESNIDPYLDEENNILGYLLRQKEAGRIRHLGFSVHGNYDTMKRFLDAYGEHMEFCQVQLNWLDYDFQNAKAKVKLLNERGIPVWVMEPLRGGKLAKLADKDRRKLARARPGANEIEWAFRFLQSLPGVTVILSGMSSYEQLAENIEIFKEDKPLTGDESRILFEIGAGMTGQVPCTACHYCVSHCPKGLDIPRIIELYNEQTFSGGGFIVSMGLEVMGKDKQPSCCIGCRSCEAVCPQNIKISEIMKDFSSRLEKKA